MAALTELAWQVGRWIVNEIIVQVLFDSIAKLAAGIFRGCRRGLQLLGALALWARAAFRRLVAITVMATWQAAVLFVPASPAIAAAIDCFEVGGEGVAAWRHPTQPDLVAVLCRHDPVPGWWDSLWIVDTAFVAAPRIIEVPLHGTGIAHFSWLDCPGPALAHVVDRTHMGTITDQVLRIQPGGRLQVVESTRLPPGSGTARGRVPCP